MHTVFIFIENTANVDDWSSFSPSKMSFFGYTVYPILSQIHLDYPLILKLFVESLEISGPLRVALVTMVTMEKAERAAWLMQCGVWWAPQS